MALLLPILAAQTASSAPNASSATVLEQANANLKRFVLDNGMVCLVKEDHSAPVVAVQIWVGTGAIDEGEFLGAGMSHFVEHMIFKGTPTRPVGRITQEINDAGGSINAYTAQDRTVFHTVMPSRNWQVGFDVLADAVMNANFPEDEWAQEREVILREIAMGRDDPGRELGKLLWSTAFKVHPFRVPVIGYEEVFKTITREDLARFFDTHYVPDNMITVIVGDIAADEVEARIRETFKPFVRRSRAVVPRPEEPAQLSPRFEQQTGAYQVSRLHLAYPSVSLNHPDAPALDVLSAIVGNGRSSRLTRDIKEERKLVYSISAWSATPKDPGLFGISATFAPEKEAEVIEAIREQVSNWRTGQFSQEELEKAKRMVLVNELSELQTMNGQASSLASGEFYAVDPRFSQQYLESVQAVDAEKVQAVARRYLRENASTLVILSPEREGGEAAKRSERIQSEREVRKITLSNGIPLIVREDHRLPFVYVTAAFKGGLLTENSSNNGITQLMSDLLTRGTDSRTSDQIADTVEGLGAYLSPFAGRNSFGLQGRALTEDAQTLMELMADCLLNPAFPQEELEKQRAVQLAAIQQQREQPFFVAEEALREILFAKHPYRWTPTGSTDAVAKLTRQEIVDHFRKHAVTGNIALSIFGNVTEAQAVELAEQWIDGIPEGDAPATAPAQPAPELPARVVNREPKQQSILLIGYPGIDLADPRADALSAIESAMSGLSSDLGIEVRDKRGLVYYVGAFNRPGLHAGNYAIYAGTREDAVEEIIGLAQDEVRRVTTQGLRQEELDRAVEQLVAEHHMSLQNNSQLAQVCALNELYGLGYDYSFGAEQRLRALTLEDVKQTAQSLFKEDCQAISIVLPAKGAAAAATGETPSQEEE